MEKTDDQEPCDGTREVARDADGCRHSDGLRLGGLTHSIRPGVPCPATVLVVGFSTGSYLLVGIRMGNRRPWSLLRMPGSCGRGLPKRSDIPKAMAHLL